MTFKTDLKLTEIFKSNSLKGYKVPSPSTASQNPCKGSNCYVWNEIKEGPIGEILDRDEKWVNGKGGYSITNYIELTENAYDLLCHYVTIYGANSESKTQTIRVIQLENDIIRIIGTGAYSSFIIFWEGQSNELLKYLIDNQAIKKDA